MSSILDMMEEDASPSKLEAFDGGGLKSAAKIATAIRETEDEIARTEAYLKEKKKDLLKLTDEDLPSVLQELGVSSFKLEDGSQVDIKPLYGASIPKPRIDEAHEWLRDNGYDDIIKNTVLCQFGRGEDDQASAFAAFAQKQGYVPEQKTEIHPQTLRAFVKERVEEGDAFPMELFGAWVGQRAVIKKGRK